MILTVVICLPLCYAALDAEEFARGWKRYKKDPVVGMAIDADATHNEQDALYICGACAPKNSKACASKPFA